MSSAENQPDPLVGQTINERFKITAVLAKGGMGKVYRAEQAPLGRVCAVKVLTPRATGEQDEDFRKRFFMEASICSKLTHPNTVTIFDYGQTTDNVFFMAMEYLDGRTLAKTLREEGPFNSERSVAIARQICRSLREAHGLGVIHRDLKPANVFLTAHGDDKDVVKVLDFGLVKNVEQPADEDLTQAGTFMGSPKYMAPEQIQGEHVDARTDIYALGVILYEMLSGHVPFDRTNQVDILLAHVQSPVPPLAEDIDPNVVSVVMKCLAKNPADRFTTMNDVLAALKQTTPQNTGTRSLAISSSGAGSIEGMTASASFTPQPGPILEGTSSPPVNVAADSAPKGNGRLWIGVALVAAVAAAAIFVVSSRTNKTDTPTTTVAAKTADKPAETTTAVATNTATGIAAPPPATMVAAASTMDVRVETDPPGARVLDDAKVILCDKTPCDVRLEQTSQTVAINLDGYNIEKLKLVAGDPVHNIKLQKRAAFAAQPNNNNKPPPGEKPPQVPGGYHNDPY